MSDYTQAPATILLSTNCVCCGRALVDACSVELGIGPECRNGIFPEGVDESDRALANKHVHHAAIAAQNGNVEKVLAFAKMIQELGFETLSVKVERRFKRGMKRVERKADIVITEDGKDFIVRTPYRRGEKDKFIKAWRSIPGRRYDRPQRVNRIPMAQRSALWDLLRTFFPNKWGKGPKGVFRVPSKPKVEKQMELGL